MKKVLLFVLATTFFQSIARTQVKYLDTVRVGKELLYMPQDAIKVDVLKILSGDVIFAYEHVFNFNNAIEIEIGPTISMIGLNRMRFLGMQKKIPNYTPTSSSTRDGTTGFLLSLGYKKYLLDGYPGLNGVFIEPRIKYRNYNTKNDFTAYNPADTKTYKDRLHQCLITMDTGMDHYFKNGFGVEYYMSLGLALNSFRYNNYYESYDDLTQTWNSGVKESKFSFVNISFSLGLKLFVGF